MNITRTEAGQGGRRGHSNMSHWTRTAEVKAMARSARRSGDRLAVAEFATEEDTDLDLIQAVPVREEDDEPTCYCRRCFLHDDPGGCVANG